MQEESTANNFSPLQAWKEALLCLRLLKSRLNMEKKTIYLLSADQHFP